MRKFVSLVLVICCGWFLPATGNAIDPGEDLKCYFQGGSTPSAGDKCAGADEWKDITFSVSVLCHNQCTGATWQSNSMSARIVYTGSCTSCPITIRRNLFTQSSDQLLQYFADATKRSGVWPTECESVSTKTASTDCYCPGCGDSSPILISLTDAAYELTSVEDGVEFDLNGDDVQEQTAWTARNSDEGFLALDRNLNGRIDDFMELFGEHSPQLPSDAPNGWRALEVWDSSLNGGNEDGKIDTQDLIYTDLLIWVDKNHNGVSEPSELASLEETGIESLSLDYDPEAGWVDSFGNGFRFPASVGWTDGSETTAWDVFFASHQ